MQSFNSCGQEFLEYKACIRENHCWELCPSRCSPALCRLTSYVQPNNHEQPITRDFRFLFYSWNTLVILSARNISNSPESYYGCFDGWKCVTKTCLLFIKMSLRKLNRRFSRISLLCEGFVAFYAAGFECQKIFLNQRLGSWNTFVCNTIFDISQNA